MTILCAENLNRWECLKKTQIRKEMVMTCSTRERGEFLPEKEISLELDHWDVFCPSSRCRYLIIT